MVFVRTATVHIAWLAGSDPGFGSFLSYVVIDHRFRYFIFLGRPHDHAGLLVHEPARKARRDQWPRGDGRPRPSGRVKLAKCRRGHNWACEGTRPYANMY